MGGDSIFFKFCFISGVSIHASTWEATVCPYSRSHDFVFQSTPPRGRRPTIEVCAILSGSFNPRLHVGGDTATRGRSWLARSFNPRLHVGGDRAKSAMLLALRCFNPRLHVGGDVLFHELHLILVRFQSTPPRGRRPCTSLRHLLPMVSIHASTWEATKLCPQGCSGLQVSIHASTWEATATLGGGTALGSVSIHASTWEATACGLLSARVLSFNPRLHVGGDHKPPFIIDNYQVSIHASTWEATYWQNSIHYHAEVSIHASTWEATHRIRVCHARVHLFQSTPPRGRRPSLTLRSTSWRVSFNPRLHVGGDNLQALCRGCHNVSIHASTWEATAVACELEIVNGVSIHASTWEATATTLWCGWWN